LKNRVLQVTRQNRAAIAASFSHPPPKMPSRSAT
jgi:hypothetical protein